MRIPSNLHFGIIFSLRIFQNRRYHNRQYWHWVLKMLNRRIWKCIKIHNTRGPISWWYCGVILSRVNREHMHIKVSLVIRVKRMDVLIAVIKQQVSALVILSERWLRVKSGAKAVNGNYVKKGSSGQIQKSKYSESLECPTSLAVLDIKQEQSSYCSS